MAPSIVDALSDDLNTPKRSPRCIVLPMSGRSDFNSAQQLHRAGRVHRSLSHALFSSEDFAAIGEAAAKLLPAEIRNDVEARIAARKVAREAKNFVDADRIRDELAAMGIELKDAKDPKTGELVTTWEVAR